MRRRRADLRPRTRDVRFNSEIVTRLIACIMKSGKKSVAERIVYGAFDRIVDKAKDKNPLDVLQSALENVKPRLEVKSRRVGGANYQVPVEVSPDRQEALAMRWMIQYAGARKGTAMTDALAAEILDASNNTGASVKKREDTHKMAQANRAFAHYRW
ncbi:MAG TPA: 30S ribosomal protein S7 [Verrucomicrobiae bacterium]|nr:30S ribosomal protein S7 [Verrucomicrobiae bacterium]